MKKILSFPVLIILFLVNTSCLHSQNVVYGKGDLVSQTRSVTGFTSISLDVPGDLYITQGGFNCTVSAQQNILDIMETEVKGTELVIKFKDHTNLRDSRDIKINVSLPNLNGIEINGSGNAYAQSDFSADKMKLEVNGSGNIKTKNISGGTFQAEVNGSGNIESTGIVSDQLSAEVNGSGNISKLSGNAKSAKLSVSGSGNIDAADVMSQEVKASVAGSGTIKIGVNGTLDADIAGSGDVYYKGTPTSIHKSVAGSGSVAPM